MRVYALATLLALAGLSLGLWTTQAALTGALPISEERLGPWRAPLRAGASDDDPYGSARFERSGEIPLGLGEGLKLAATTDSEGRRLDARCLYRVGPTAPPARYWTLSAETEAGFPVENAARTYGLRSSEILREPDGAFWIALSNRAQPGNWLPLGGQGAFVLALRLYDPALTGLVAGADAQKAPRIERVRCS